MSTLGSTVTITFRIRRPP